MRWLVIGAGAAGGIHVRELLARGHDVAVADIDWARAEALAKAAGCDLFADCLHYDGAVVATPACTRMKLTPSALSHAGVVVCEKPLGLTAADAEAIAALAPGRVYVAESQCYGGADGLDVARMAERLRAGAFGGPVIWRVRAMTSYRPQAWCTDLAVGGGAFLEGGVHVLTTARVLFGEAVRWQGMVQKFAGGTGPDAGTLLVEYEHGDQLELALDWGTEGCFDGRCQPMTSSCGLVGAQTWEAWWPPDNHGAMWTHLLKCIAGEAEPVATLAHAAGAVADVWRCYAAAGITLD